MASSLFKKGFLSVLSEASESDVFYDTTLPFVKGGTPDIDVVQTDDILDDMEDDVEAIEDLDDDIVYSEESTPVHYDGKRDRYLIEYDNIAKYMGSVGETSTKKAIENICECNNIEYKKTYLVMDSSDDVKSFVNESKAILKGKGSSTTKEDKKSALVDAKKKLEDLKKTGVKMLKKKSCKK